MVIGYRTLPGTDHPAAPILPEAADNNEKAHTASVPTTSSATWSGSTASSSCPLLRAPAGSGYRQVKDRHHRIRHFPLGLIEARDQLRQEYNIETDYLRPARVSIHSRGPRLREATRGGCYVVEQNRDAQMLTLLKMDLEAALHTGLRSIAHIHGLPLDARSVTDELMTMEGK